jgi:hypothetical protein
LDFLIARGLRWKDERHLKSVRVRVSDIRDPARGRDEHKTRGRHHFRSKRWANRLASSRRAGEAGRLASRAAGRRRRAGAGCCRGNALLAPQAARDCGITRAMYRLPRGSLSKHPFHREAFLTLAREVIFLPHCINMIFGR